MICRSYSKVYLERGVIVKQSCRFQGCPREPQMHHPDYSQPLLVIWLCREHHLEIHSNPAMEAKISGQYAPLRFRKITRTCRRLRQHTQVTVEREACLPMDLT